jgi:hypothetical protein
VYSDYQSGRFVLSSQMGPTLSQATDVAEVAAGEPRFSETFQEALPASPAWEKRVGSEVNVPTTEEVMQ